MSFLSGILPAIWKTAIVCPVFKKGDPSQPINYRPISLTCIICKVMEAIINKYLSGYLRKNNLITESQFGFISRRSTCTQLLSTLNTWTTAVNNKFKVDAIFIDFAKAFDSVCHSKLICKLEAIGIK
jgi:hypothetical protein